MRLDVVQWNAFLVEESLQSPELVGGYRCQLIR